MCPKSVSRIGLGHKRPIWRRLRPIALARVRLMFKKATQRVVFGEREAGVLGFEPRQTDPESVVLPLHYTPIGCLILPLLDGKNKPLRNGETQARSRLGFNLLTAGQIRRRTGR